LELACSFDLALEASASEGELQVGCTKAAKDLDDSILAEVGGIRHRRSPVAFYPSGILTQQAGIAQHHGAHRLDITVPDGVGHAAGGNQARPTGKAITAGKHKLRIGEPGRCGIDRFGLIFAEIGNRFRIAAANGAQQIFRLMLELVEVGTDGKVTACH
jgi:hypothetical protein